MFFNHGYTHCNVPISKIAPILSVTLHPDGTTVQINMHINYYEQLKKLNFVKKKLFKKLEH